jgi:hypothetical protein
MRVGLFRRSLFLGSKGFPATHVGDKIINMGGKKFIHGTIKYTEHIFVSLTSVA